jgi:hypothetical protein
MLPPELVHSIMSYLPALELFNVSRVCSEWNDVAEVTKWERTIPQWRLDKIPKELTFSQRQQYLKHHVLEFMNAKRDMKLFSVNKHPSQIRLSLMRRYEDSIYMITFRALTLLASVMTILLASEASHTHSMVVLWAIGTVLALFASYHIYVDYLEGQYSWFEPKILTLSLVIGLIYIEIFIIHLTLVRGYTWFLPGVPVLLTLIYPFGLACICNRVEKGTSYAHCFAFVLACVLYGDGIIPSFNYVVPVIYPLIIIRTIESRKSREIFKVDALFFILLSLIAFQIGYIFSTLSWLLCNVTIFIVYYYSKHLIE